MTNIIPASHILRDGEPWYQVNMLATTLDMTERAVRKLAAKLPASETSVLPVPTSNRGLQDSLFVSRPGAIEIALLSKSPVRAEVVRQIMGALATTPAADPVLSQMLAAQTTAMQGLFAQQQALAARVTALEARPARRAAKPTRRHGCPEVPDEEIAAFFDMWRKATVNFERTSYLAEMAHVHDLLPSLLGRCTSDRSRQTTLGRWLAHRPEVEHHRSAHRRAVRLRPGAQVIDLAARRQA